MVLFHMTSRRKNINWGFGFTYSVQKSNPELKSAGLHYRKQTHLKKLTENTITNPDKLLTHLKEIRKAGVAVSKQEITAGAWGVAAPIYNIHQKVIAGLVVTGPIQRLDDKKLQKNKKIVIEYARKISSKCSR